MHVWAGEGKPVTPLVLFLFDCFATVGKRAFHGSPTLPDYRRRFSSVGVAPRCRSLCFSSKRRESSSREGSPCPEHLEETVQVWKALGAVSTGGWGGSGWTGCDGTGDSGVDGFYTKG